MAYSYHCNPLGKEAEKIIFADSELKETYETIKVLSDDFTNKDDTAVELDEMLKDILISLMDEKPSSKPTPKPKPATKKRKFANNEQVLANIYVGGKNKGHIFFVADAHFENDVWIYYIISESGEDGSHYVAENKLEKYKEKPTAELPLPKGKKSKEQVIKELLEQLEENQESPVSAEQVKTIVENVLNTRKICFEDLCADLTKAIKETTNIKIYLPEYTTKPFNDDTPNLLKIIDDVSLGNNVMLIGGAGTGKTFLAEKVASIMGLETEVINCNQFTSPIEINGGQTIEGYQEGKLIKAWSEGKILILDELPKLDSNTAGILNEALAKTNLPATSDRAFIVNTRGDRFRKKTGFGVIATGNVYPNTESSTYGANNKQDLSLLDRFAGSVYEIEKNPEFEKKVILPGHLFIWEVCDKIRTLVEKNKWEAQVSIRLMETSLRVYLAEMKGIKEREVMDDNRKCFKDVIDSFIWTFTEVQQVEIKREIKYSEFFEKYQYRKINIDKNPY